MVVNASVNKYFSYIDKDDKLQAMHLIFQLCTQHIQKKIDLDFIEETSDIGLFLFACESFQPNLNLTMTS
jgi:hypothetical protein